ncbi:uncharacterized protein LOC105420124 [Amborella trichopoda]|uniref:uncharacterized protein LOC105420124 n=1 Tax=Amborella trichopoda TaxID=13333 RepID=UPI0005D45111|nr:uncharacterized protein LOC105420124 [Amborella trichopoda]|eukprot:XP_011620843.1 uncharacterized protein LOC105420124 [Amborella trichopoda]
MAIKDIHGSQEEAYNQSPVYVNRVMKTNPGSYATKQVWQDGRFRRMFISFYGSIHGFRSGCRLLIFLDGTLLKVRYLGTLLAANSIDGEEQVFPVAFTIEDAENREITLLSDRHFDLVDTICQVFENAHHAFCEHHLVENFKKEAKDIPNDIKKTVIKYFVGACRAYRPQEYFEKMSEIRSISEDAFKCWIIAARDMPNLQCVDLIRRQIMKLMATRNLEAETWTTTLTSHLQNELRLIIKQSLSVNVTVSSGAVVEAMGARMNYKVTWQPYKASHEIAEYFICR